MKLTVRGGVMSSIAGDRPPAVNIDPPMIGEPNPAALRSPTSEIGRSRKGGTTMSKDIAALIAAWDNNNDGHDVEATVRAGCAIRDALESATRKDSLTVHTVAELDALPVGSLIEAHRKAIYRRRRGAWSELDGADRFQPNVGWLPATILWTPGEATH